MFIIQKKYCASWDEHSVRVSPSLFEKFMLESDYKFYMNRVIMSGVSSNEGIMGKH